MFQSQVDPHVSNLSRADGPRLLVAASVAFAVGAILAAATWLWIENGPAIILQLVASSAAFLCL